MTKKRPGRGKPSHEQQPYVRMLNAAIRGNKLPLAPGGLIDVAVYHDDDCPKLKGGLCNCQPEIRCTPVRLPDEQG